MDTMIAAYAGLPAQQIFYRECPVHCADGDEEFIRDLLASADDDDFADLASEEMQTRIKLQAKTLVNKHSVVIKEVAEELWATPCTNRNEQDEPNPTWSKSKMEKTLGGKRLLEILEKFGIQAFVWDPGPRIAPAE
jgi:hypothetical protein